MHEELAMRTMKKKPLVPELPPESPKEALQRLLEGNERFVNGEAEESRRGLDSLRNMRNPQRPFAAVLACADSRVPVEIIFDQGFGDMFVARVAGNIVTADKIASLEFGTLILGAQVLMVLGHSGCGAVQAAMEGQDLPGQINVLFQHLHDAVIEGEGEVSRAIEANVLRQARLLGASPVLSRLVAEGKLAIVGAVVDVETGRVRMLTPPL